MAKKNVLLRLSMEGKKCKELNASFNFPAVFFSGGFMTESVLMLVFYDILCKYLSRETPASKRVHPPRVMGCILRLV